MEPQLSFRIGVNDEFRLAVRQGLTATNSKRSAEMRRLYASEFDRPEQVEVYVTADDGSLLGGAYGVVRWRWFDLQAVWLSESIRGGGMGKTLIETVEAAARSAGATAVRLDTLDFGARGFYEKCGYRVYGELPGYPETHTLYLMAKKLFGPAAINTAD